MKTIYAKNFLATASLILLSFLMIGVALVLTGKSYIISSHRSTMESDAEFVERIALYLCPNGDFSDLSLRTMLTGAQEITGNHIMITDPDGVVVSCSDEPWDCRHIGEVVNLAPIYSMRYSGEPIDGQIDLGGAFGGRRYVYSKPMVYSRSTQSGSTEKVLGYVFVSIDSSTITGVWRTFLWVLLAFSLALLTIALLLSLFYSKRLAKPLDEMAAAASKFAHGDFSVRVTPVDETEELSALTSAFNDMADSLERSEEQRNEFIANVSHELKTPMTTIAGFADGILDGTIPKEQEDKYLVIIADETRRLSRLVRNMLSMSRMKSVGADMTKRRVFDLNELITNVTLSFETKLDDRKLGMDLQLPEDHISVLADPDAITQVVYNLMDNAVKFAAEGTDITVLLWKQEGKAYVSVKDRGETIPPDDLPLIFDRFHKSDRSRSLDRDGVGLGLSLVKSILDSHNEDIAVTSRDGVTEFVFTLRLAKAEAGKNTETRAINKKFKTNS